MARIEEAKTRNPLVKAAYAATRKEFGKVITPVQILAHHPKMLAAFGVMDGLAASSNHVEKHLKDLVQLRAALVVDCPFCIDAASALSRRSGASVEQIRNLYDYESNPAFSELERLCLEYTDCLTRTPAEVPDTLYARLAKHFTSTQLVELTMAIAWENCRARFNKAFEVQSDELADACPVRPAESPSNGSAEAAI